MLTVARQSSPLPDMGRADIFNYIEQFHNSRRRRHLQMLKDAFTQLNAFQMELVVAPEGAEMVGH